MGARDIATQVLSSGAAGAGSGGATYQVNISLPAGKNGTVNMASKSDAETLTGLLKQLELDMARS